MLQFSTTILAIALLLVGENMQVASQSPCPENMTFEECGTLCPLTCKNKPNEPIKCIRGCNKDRSCFCEDGFVLLTKDSNTCVKWSDCPVQACPENMTFEECGTLCPLTCKNKPNEPIKCIRGCNKDRSCFCEDGFVLLTKDSNTCVKWSDCPVQACPENMTFEECGTLCPLTCKNKPNEPIKCIRGCNKDRSCFCEDGFVLLTKDSNTCVKWSDCPVQVCPDGMQFLNCAPCGTTCDNMNLPCTKECKDPGCYCKDDFVLLNEQCVEKIKCPVKECPDGLVYWSCAPCGGTCETLNQICTLDCKNPGCYCKKGTVLLNGVCVDKARCPI